MTRGAIQERIDALEIDIAGIREERDQLREELRVTREALHQLADSHRVERLFRELAAASQHFKSETE